jgi:hypothetical protein
MWCGYSFSKEESSLVVAIDLSSIHVKVARSTSTSIIVIIIVFLIIRITCQHRRRARCSCTSSCRPTILTVYTACSKRSESFRILRWPTPRLLVSTLALASLAIIAACAVDRAADFGVAELIERAIVAWRVRYSCG